MNFTGVKLILMMSFLSFFTLRAQEFTLKQGDKAPDFSLSSDEGNTVKLSDFEGKSIIILYFYPKDKTPGCTKEACNFRDNLEKFDELGAKVLGVSVDDIDSHRSFKEKENLNFTLLADSEKKVTKKYGVLNKFGIASRVTFVIDKQGIVKKIYEKVDPANNYKELLEYLKTMQ